MIYEYKINDLLPYQPVNLSVSPVDINYKTGLRQRLHKVLNMISGQIVTAKYYRFDEYGEATDDQILQVDFEWLRDESGRLIEQKRLYRWNLFDSDDFGPHIKSDIKRYTAQEAAIADARRRSNIVDSLISQSELFGVDANLKLMLRELDAYVSTYKSMNDREIVSQIGAYNGGWLDADACLVLPHLPAGTKLRQIVMSELNYAD